MRCSFKMRDKTTALQRKLQHAKLHNYIIEFIVSSIELDEVAGRHKK